MRKTMVEKVRTVWKKPITEEVLLGGSGIQMPNASWATVVDAVTKYVEQTGRDI